MLLSNAPACHGTVSLNGTGAASMELSEKGKNVSDALRLHHQPCCFNASLRHLYMCVCVCCFLVVVFLSSRCGDDDVLG